LKKSRKLLTGKANSRGGSWDVRVTIRNCQTGAVISSFPTLNTFMQGGTMQETSAGVPPGLRSPGHGVWNYESGRRYTAAFQFYRFNTDGSYAGTLRTRTQIEVSRFSNSFTSTASTEVFNPAGVLIATGCATATGTRFE
jgi:hypothetical protein